MLGNRIAARGAAPPERRRGAQGPGGRGGAPGAGDLDRLPARSMRSAMPSPRAVVARPGAPRRHRPGRAAAPAHHPRSRRSSTAPQRCARDLRGRIRSLWGLALLATACGRPSRPKGVEEIRDQGGRLRSGGGRGGRRNRGAGSGPGRLLRPEEMEKVAAPVGRHAPASGAGAGRMASCLGASAGDRELRIWAHIIIRYMCVQEDGSPTMPAIPDRARIETRASPGPQPARPNPRIVSSTDRRSAGGLPPGDSAGKRQGESGATAARRMAR